MDYYKSSETLRRRFIRECSDLDCNTDKTTSWLDGLHEVHRFVPYMPRPLRRTRSVEDIECYKDYFLLAQRNQGKHFTWKHYTKILQEDMLHFDTLVLMSKMSLQGVATASKSTTSVYSTASESKYPKAKRIQYCASKKRPFFEIGSDTGSISDSGSTISFTPQKNVLKKMCSEIRTLAIKTCKTVEKISITPKYCAACGDYVGGVKSHKKCSQTRLDYEKPITPSMLKSANLIRKGSSSSESEMKPSNCSGAFLIDQQPFRKIRFPPQTVCKVKPYTRQARRSRTGSGTN